MLFLQVLSDEINSSTTSSAIEGIFGELFVKTISCQQKVLSILNLILLVCLIKAMHCTWMSINGASEYKCEHIKLKTLIRFCDILELLGSGPTTSVVFFILEEIISIANYWDAERRQALFEMIHMED